VICLKIKTRIQISAILVICVVSAIGLTLFFMSQQENEALEQDTVANEILEGAFQLNILTGDYFLHQEERAQMQWYLKHGSLSELLKGLELGDEEQFTIDKIRQNHEDIGNIFSQLEASYEWQETTGEESEIRKLLMAQLSVKIHDMVSDATLLSKGAQESVKTAVQMTGLLVMIFSIVLAAGIGLNSLFLISSIAKPVAKLHHGVEMIENGNLDYQVGTSARDEIGQLSRSFDQMTLSLSEEITERKKAQDELQKANDALEIKVAKRTKELHDANIRLKELDRLKGTFISSMSHELRTPLNSIIGFTGIMLQGMVGELTEEQRKQLTIVKKNSDHLLALISDVIDVSQIEANQVKLDIKEFNFSDMMRDVRDSFKVATDEKDLKLILNVPEKLTVESDERRIKQIIINFVNNAVKFTDEGVIEITVVEGDGVVEVSVEDTGIGIRKEDLNMLFKQFSRIHGEGRQIEKGTGLGLYVSKKVSDLLGGKIKVESTYGVGSKFTATFPLSYGKAMR